MPPLHASERRWRGDDYDQWRLHKWRALRDAWCGVRDHARGDGYLAARLHGRCVLEIVRIETGGTFSPTVTNRSSGAYGLPQALPGHKMASAGTDWRTNPLTQLRWMRGYVRSVYGGACHALASHHRKGWY